MTRRILVAEDETVVAFDLCDTVEEAGFEVEGPHAGVGSAMLALQRDRPDLAILDLDLKDGDMVQFASKLAAEHVPIIFHTNGKVGPDMAEQFPQATLLAKPCPPSQMIGAVQQMLECAPIEA